MKFLFFAALVSVAVLGAFYIGCGPRASVAADAAIQKIDDLLGPLNVKQKAVEQKLAKLESASENLRKKRIEAQVRLERLQKSKEDYESNAAKIKQDLKKLKTMLADAESEGKVERNGKTFTVDQLNSFAESYIQKLKAVNDELKRNDTISNAWAKNFDVLSKQETTSAAQLKTLKSQLAEIQSKKSALDGMRQAATITGSNASISDEFNEVSKSVEELMINVDTEFAIEEAKLEERMAEMDAEVHDIDELLNNKADVSSTISDIDALLGEDK
ncbi:MAG: hypothetical protein AAF939_14595 [Planctomycetota bacterium]